jgi:hypothetical protein
MTLVRQWVLSLPRLRYVLAWDLTLARAVTNTSIESSTF